MQGAIQPGTWQLKTLLDAVTASATSEEVVIAGAKRITLIFTRANHSAGSSAFDVDVSLDGVNYVGFNKLVRNLANTNVQTITRDVGVTLSSDTSVMVSMDLQHDAFFSMIVNVVETTDGTHTCKALIEY